MFICIDGSGPDDDVEYHRAFSHSFLVQILEGCTQAHRRWYRGPNSSGGHQVGLTMVAREAIARRRIEEDTEGDAARVFLAGYSRGAAGIVHVAYLLEDMHIPVDGMFLFDAVDRSRAIGDSLRVGNVDVVPANVQAVFHARRSAAAESRESFGSTATSAARPGAYEQEIFLTTHGGMGGTPWGYTALESGRWSLGDEYRSPATTAARRAWIRRHGMLVEHDEYADSLEVLGAWATGEPSDGYTTVTMAQEEAGAQACADWMWVRLRRLGAVHEASTPRVVPRRGDFGHERF